MENSVQFISGTKFQTGMFVVLQPLIDYTTKRSDLISKSIKMSLHVLKCRCIACGLLENMISHVCAYQTR